MEDLLIDTVIEAAATAAEDGSGILIIVLSWPSLQVDFLESSSPLCVSPQNCVALFTPSSVVIIHSLGY